MISKKAEEIFFNEFKDFSVGFYDDFTAHYNSIEEGERRDYYFKIVRQSKELNTEIKANLLYLADSKPKTQKYLKNLHDKLLEAWHKLDENEHDAKRTEIVPYDPCEISFQEALWEFHVKKVEEFIAYCRLELRKLSTTKISAEDKKSFNAKIPWLGGSRLLKILHFQLISTVASKEKRFSKVFIRRISFQEFEKHFFSELGEPIICMDWIREKYLLTFLFGELSKNNYFDNSFKKNGPALLAEHFTYKGKPITTRQISSTKDTFKNSTTGTSPRKQPGLYYIREILHHLDVARETETKEAEKKSALTQKNSSKSNN